MHRLLLISLFLPLTALSSELPEPPPSSPSGLWIIQKADGKREFTNIYRPGAKPYVPSGGVSVIPIVSASSAPESTESPSRGAPPISPPANPERILQDAKNALASGAEPLPGERAANAGGGSRLTEEYFERQKRLKQAVEEAEKLLGR